MASDPQGVVGYQGVLPWHVPSELEHFRAVTKDHTIVMGRRTWEHLPKSLLKHRSAVVLSQRHEHVFWQEGALWVPNWQALNEQSLQGQGFVIGGAVLVNHLLRAQLLDRFILTLMKSCFLGDATLNLRFFRFWQCHAHTEHEQYAIFHLSRH